MIYLKDKQIKDSEYPDLIIATYEEIYEEMDASCISVYFYNEICDMNYKYVFKAIIKTINLLMKHSFNTKMHINNEQSNCLYIKIALKYLKNNLLKKENKFYTIDNDKVDSFKYKKLIPNILYPMMQSRLKSKISNNFFKVNQEKLTVGYIFDYYKKFKKGRFLPLEDKLKETIKDYEISILDGRNTITYLMNSLENLNEYIKLSGWTEGKQIIKNSLEFIYNLIKNDKARMSTVLYHHDILEYNKKLAVDAIRSYISYNSNQIDWDHIQKVLYGKEPDKNYATALDILLFKFREELKKHY